MFKLLNGLLLTKVVFINFSPKEIQNLFSYHQLQKSQKVFKNVFNI